MKKKSGHKRAVRRYDYSSKISYDLAFGFLDLRPYISRRHDERWDVYEKDYWKDRQRKKRNERKRYLSDDVLQYREDVIGRHEEYGARIDYAKINSEALEKARRLRREAEKYKKILVCERRRDRRIILFKRNLIGKGKRVSPKRILREDSEIKCKDVRRRR